ncbi:MAG TPA: 3'(2'),5'-bisphosphate nucleotidase CysQ [Myxococcota bacterium]|nr:3'(2'),5'-bisphosphate nucleotidase CysQ [Myxococcota bacterium]
MQSDLTAELDCAELLARAAGRMALDLRHNLTVVSKANNQGPVTNADVAIDRYIVRELGERYPHDQIVSEEGGLPEGYDIGPGRTWFIDPIDGTTNYIAGGNDFVVMIGLAIDGAARLGAIYQPIEDRLWRGVVSDTSGRAERLDGNGISALRLNLVKKSHNDIVAIVSRTHKSLRQNAMIKALGPKKIRYQSSFGLKAMLVLEQYADLYVAWSRQIKKWDTCAPAAIVKAAGGHVSFIDQQELTFLGPVAHNKAIMVASMAPDETLWKILYDIAKDAF